MRIPAKVQLKLIKLRGGPFDGHIQYIPVEEFNEGVYKQKVFNVEFIYVVNAKKPNIFKYMGERIVT